MAKPKRNTTDTRAPLEPANDARPHRRKRESQEERKLREWHERCQRLVRERAPWLREEEAEMLRSQARDNKPPTENREKYASLIAHQTEPLSGIDGVEITDLMVMVARIKSMFDSVEEEERFDELSRMHPTRLPRRDARWLLSVAEKLAM